MFKFDNVSFKMNKRRLRANFVLPSRGIVFLEGQNGSGKSTLLRCLMGRKRYKGKILIDDTIFKGHIFSSRSRLRANIAYLSPIQQNQFMGLTLEMLIKDHQFDSSLIDLFRKVYLPTNTEYNSLSSGERSLFHLAYALIKPRSILVIDELLSSLSVTNQEIVSSYFCDHRDKYLVILTSQKKLETIKFDAHYKIFDGSVETIIAPKESTNLILVNNYKKTKSTVGATSRSSIWPKVAKGIILCSLFSSLMVVFNPSRNEYNTALRDIRFFDTSEISDDEQSYNNQTMTVLKLNFSMDGMDQIRFIASPNTGPTIEAINLFPGQSLTDRQKALVEMIDTYFDFNLNKDIRKKMFIGNSFSEVPQVFVTLSELKEVQKRLIYLSGEYLLPSIDTLIDNESVILLNDEKLSDYILEGEPLILSSHAEVLKYNGVLKCIGYVNFQKATLSPSFAYTNKKSHERYLKESLFAKSNSMLMKRKITLFYTSNPEMYMDDLPYEIRKLHKEQLPSYILPIVLPIIFCLYLVVEVFRKKTLVESIEIDSGTPQFLRWKNTLVNSYKPIISICFMYILLAFAITFTTDFSFLNSIAAMLISLPFLLICCVIIAIIRSLVLTKSRE